MESRRHSVVIVEDEGLIAADLRGRLEKVGYSVPAMASSAGAALEVIREKSPDLILMDIRLQGNLDGIQVAEQVRQHFDIPVVYLTAYEDRKTLERASQTQAFGYIKKPVDSACLQGSIELAISKHRHERYLRQQRDWFSASFAAVPDAILATDSSGRICYLNPAAEEMLGCKVADALGKPSSELLRLRHWDGRLVDDLVPVAMLQGTPLALPSDIWLEGGGGRRSAIEGSLTPRWRDGRADGVVVSCKDVTLRRFEEEQSRQDSRHDALSRLADGIAGHLDLELSVVAEESTRLLNTIPSDSLLRSAAETIEGAALDAFAVTCRLRAFGQDREIKPQVIHVNDVLKDLEKTWREVLTGLSVHLDPAPKPVHADACELTRSLDMLLQHARRAMDPGSALEIAASSVELQGLHEWVRIRMSYTSANEDSIALDRVFDPSWDGNWEGLPFTYGVVRRMGGLLRARMEADKRVVFEIYLASLEVAPARVPMEGEHEKVLLVIEKNAEVRRILRVYFEQHGYQVLEADSCQNALTLAGKYERPIQLALACPAIEDQCRRELAAGLENLKPGICVRMLEGYRGERAGTVPVEGETAGCYLTKRELLEWANHAWGLRTVSAAG